MIAVRALMNPAAQAAQAELCLGLRRTIRAVRIHIRSRVGLVQKSIEFLAVMHTRIGHVVLPDQLVVDIRIHVVLVAVEALAVLLGPARVLVFLPVFRRVLLPRLRRLADLHVVIPVAAIALFGNRHDRGINHLAAARNVALRLQMLAKAPPRPPPGTAGYWGPAAFPGARRPGSSFLPVGVSYRLARQRADAHGRRIGIGRGELEKEVQGGTHASMARVLRGPFCAFVRQLRARGNIAMYPITMAAAARLRLQARRLATSLLALLVATAIAHADGLKVDAKPKLGPNATPIQQSYQYLRTHDAPDYWRLSPYYVPQISNSACSLATIATLINALRGLPALANEDLVSQASLLAAVAIPDWARKTAEHGEGVTWGEFKTYLALSLKAFGLEADIETFRPPDASEASLVQLRQVLADNERAHSDIALGR